MSAHRIRSHGLGQSIKRTDSPGVRRRAPLPPADPRYREWLRPRIAPSVGPTISGAPCGSCTRGMLGPASSEPKAATSLGSAPLARVLPRRWDSTTLERQRFRNESSAKQTELLDSGAGIPVEMTSRSQSYCPPGGCRRRDGRWAMSP